MLGTLINAGAVVIGSIVGLLVHSRLPSRITAIAFQGIGLFTLFLGVATAAQTSNYLVMIFSIVVGAVLGELADLDGLVNRFGEWSKRRLGFQGDKFSEGLITSLLLFCTGSMTILGSIEEGLGGISKTLLAKSVLDGFSSVALSASLGVGVIFSAIPLLAYQGALTLLAGSLKTFFTATVISELSSVGGLLLMGLGINILDIKKLKIVNMLPSLLVTVVLASLFP
jgi:uncharacterized membrane protein YqgA involved in biofilm formation